MDGNTPHRLRLGAVPYLNVEPLVWALENGEISDGHPAVELIAATPRDLAAMLVEGRVEAGIVPVAEALRTGRWLVVPGVSIACDGPVLSVVMLSKVPPGDIRSLLLDRSSMTSILLGQLLLREIHGARPSADLSSSPLRADHDFEADPHDAFILIGDEALRSMNVPMPWRVDLGEAWKTLTGMPFVFAVWAMRADDGGEALLGAAARARAEAVSRLLVEAAVRGRRNLETVCRVGAARHALPLELVRPYLTHAIHHGLGPRDLAAVGEFGRRLVGAGLLETAHPLVFAPAPAPDSSPGKKAAS